MFSEKQADVILNANSRWNILSGAVRSGKTFVSYDLIIRRLVELPDGDRLLIGRTQQTLERNVLNPLRKRIGTSFVSHVNSKNTVYIAGKPFYVVGADNKEAVTKIQGMGLIYAYGDEITTWHPDVFQMLKSRLSDKGALFDGTCNPDTPHHWLKTDIIDNPDVNASLWHFVIDDNPFLPPEYVESLKNEYTGVFYQRYILGEWVLAEGLIYPNAQQAVVETSARAYSEYQVSCDYGIHNPTCFGLFGLSDGVWYMIREYYHSGRETNAPKTDQEYYNELEKFIDGLPVRRIIVDPSASSFITLIRKNGKYRVQEARNSVLDGIRSTSTALANGAIKINDSCTHMTDEFNVYSWDDKSLEDRPIKDNDHMCDLLRYFVFTNNLALPKRKPMIRKEAFC